VARHTPDALEAGSLVQRVCAWFARHHPDEQLSAADVALGFDVATAHLARKGLAPALEQQWLVLVSDHGTPLYQRGPKFDEPLVIPTTKQLGVQMPPAQLNGAFPVATPKTRRAAVPLPPLDVTKIKIEQGVPKPRPKTSRGGLYTPLIEKLQPGQSFVLPAGHAKRLLDWAKKLGASKQPVQKFSIRKVDDNHSRVWRDA